MSNLPIVIRAPSWRISRTPSLQINKMKSFKLRACNTYPVRPPSRRGSYGFGLLHRPTWVLYMTQAIPPQTKPIPAIASARHLPWQQRDPCPA